jgi:hypothetical protein
MWDGSDRCVPGVPVVDLQNPGPPSLEVYFSDGSCSTPVVRLATTFPVPVFYASFAWIDGRRARLYKLGSPYPDGMKPGFILSTIGQCVPVAPSSGPYFYATEIPPTDLVKRTVQVN